MDVAVGIAGALCLALAGGHATIGLVWVLPAVRAQQLPETPFGPPSLTSAMIHVTWHLITVFVVAIGLLLLTLAWDVDANARTLLLRVIAAMWLAAAMVASWVALRRVHRLRDVIRLPVPAFFVLIALLCWNASA